MVDIVERLRTEQPSYVLIGDAAIEIERLRAEKERLGRQVNIAKYGEPDFAWSFHQAAMADLRNEIEQLRGQIEFEKKCRNDAFDELKKQDAEIERLRDEVAKWKRLDSEAANYVESVICMRSLRFTGDPPYVGWKGLGLALSQDYDEIERLREALKDVDRALVTWLPDHSPMRQALQNFTRSAIQQKDSEK